MAYVTTNLPYKTSGGFGSGHTEWAYSSADDDGTVMTAGYITNPLALGMKLLDVVTIYDTATPKVSKAYISAISATSTTMSFVAVA